MQRDLNVTSPSTCCPTFHPICSASWTMSWNKNFQPTSLKLIFASWNLTEMPKCQCLVLKQYHTATVIESKSVLSILWSEILVSAQSQKQPNWFSFDFFDDYSGTINVLLLTAFDFPILATDNTFLVFFRINIFSTMWSNSLICLTIKTIWPIFFFFYLFEVEAFNM